MLLRCFLMSFRWSLLSLFIYAVDGAQGATDLEIHDTVLIAAAFCMFNRYVDGLATWAPAEPESYRARASTIAEKGYGGIPTDVSSARAASGLPGNG